MGGFVMATNRAAKGTFLLVVTLTIALVASVDESYDAIPAVDSTQARDPACDAKKSALACPAGYESTGKPRTRFYKVKEVARRRSRRRSRRRTSVCVTVQMDQCVCSGRDKNGCPAGCTEQQVRLDKKATAVNWETVEKGTFKALFRAAAATTPSTNDLKVAVAEAFKKEYDGFIVRRSKEIASLSCDKKQKRRSVTNDKQVQAGGKGEPCKAPFAKKTTSRKKPLSQTHIIYGSEKWADCTVKNPLVQLWMTEVGARAKDRQEVVKSQSTKSRSVLANNREVRKLLAKGLKEEFPKCSNFRVEMSKSGIAFYRIHIDRVKGHPSCGTAECKGDIRVAVSMAKNPSKPMCADNGKRGKTCEPLVIAKLYGQELKSPSQGTLSTGVFKGVVLWKKGAQYHKDPACVSIWAKVQAKVRRVLSAYRFNKAEQALK